MAIDSIRSAIAKQLQCDPASIAADADLADLGIDSLKAINVIFELEEEYDIEIPNEIIAQLKTVADIETELTRLLEKAG